MGDPRKTRKTYSRPAILWNETTLAQDKEIKRDYKPKNKKEIWKMTAVLENIKAQAKSITSRLGTARKERALLEKDLLIAKVKRLGLIRKDEIDLSDLLNLSLHDIMERRLQTIVFRRKLAKTVSQARQFIVHGHIKIGDKKITSPSYLVLLEEESLVSFVEKSPMSKEGHPERGDYDPKQKEDSKSTENKGFSKENVDEIAELSESESEDGKDEDASEVTETSESENAEEVSEAKSGDAVSEVESESVDDLDSDKSTDVDASAGTDTPEDDDVVEESKDSKDDSSVVEEKKED